MVDERDGEAVRAHLHHAVGRVAGFKELVLVQRRVLVVVGHGALAGVFAGQHGHFAVLRAGVDDAQRIELGIVHALDAHPLAGDVRGGVGESLGNEAQQAADDQHHQRKDQVGPGFFAEFFHMDLRCSRAAACGSIWGYIAIKMAGMAIRKGVCATSGHFCAARRISPAPRMESGLPAGAAREAVFTSYASA